MTFPAGIAFDPAAPAVHDIGERLHAEFYGRGWNATEMARRAKQVFFDAGGNPSVIKGKAQGLPTVQRVKELTDGREKRHFWRPDEHAWDNAFARDWEVELYAAALGLTADELRKPLDEARREQIASMRAAYKATLVAAEAEAAQLEHQRALERRLDSEVNGLFIDDYANLYGWQVTDAKLNLPVARAATALWTLQTSLVDAPAGQYPWWESIESATTLAEALVPDDVVGNEYWSFGADGALSGLLTDSDWDWPFPIELAWVAGVLAPFIEPGGYIEWSRVDHRADVGEHAPFRWAFDGRRATLLLAEPAWKFTPTSDADLPFG